MTSDPKYSFAINSTAVGICDPYFKYSFIVLGARKTSKTTGLEGESGRMDKILVEFPPNFHQVSPVFESPISAPSAVGSTLPLQAFPSLRSVGYKDEDADDIGRWGEIEALLVKLRPIPRIWDC